MEDGNRRIRLITLSIALALLTVAVYWPVTGHGFINFDDQDYVTANKQVQAGLSGDGLRWAFGNGLTGNWHPLTWLSHMLDCQLFGLNAGWHHSTNLLLHTLNAVLLLVVLERMTRSVWKSFFVAALFALHPLHVESVAWVAERKDLLSGFFFMLTLWAYARYVSESKVQSPKSRVCYGLSLVSFALGLMSKPMLVTVPFVLLLLDFWPLKRMSGVRCQVSGRDTHSIDLPPRTLPRTLLWEKLPFFALTVATSVVTMMMQKQAGAMALMDSAPLASRLANAAVSYGRYVLKMFWPADLSVFYPLPNAWPAGVVVGAVVFLLAATVMAIWFRREFPYLAVGWFWFAGMLIPVIGLVQVGLQSMADRYTYLPLIGLFIVLAWGAGAIAVHWRVPEGALRIAAGVALAACGALTAQQVRYWKNSETLFTHALESTRENAVAHYSLGVICSETGRMDEAFAHFSETVRLRPNQGEALNNLGLLLVMRGQIDEGITRYRQALAAKLNIAALHFNLASALAAKGESEEAIGEFKSALRIQPDFPEAQWALARLQIRRGNLLEAEATARSVLKREPGNADAHLVVGLASVARRDFEAALRHLNEALRLKPQDADIHIELADVLVAAGQAEQAREHYQAALRLQPDLPGTLKRSAQALVNAGDLAGAVNALERSSRITPDDADIQRNLAILLVQKGRLDDAVAHFSEVIRLRPDADAHRNLASVLILKGRSDEAVSHLREAVRQKPDWAVAMNDLSWILATHPDQKLRDGREAVRLGEQACRLTDYREPQFIGTLAAAYAEAGRFDEAIKTGERAREAASAAGLTALADRNAQLLKEYRAQKPHREPTSAP